jgi:hypothetical protein
VEQGTARELEVTPSAASQVCRLLGKRQLHPGTSWANALGPACPQQSLGRWPQPSHSPAGCALKTQALHLEKIRPLVPCVKQRRHLQSSLLDCSFQKLQSD